MLLVRKVFVACTFLALATPALTDTCTVAAIDGSHATAVIYRYRAFAGSGRHSSIYVDEQKVCSLTNGRYLVVHLPQGPHKLRSSDPKHGGAEHDFRAGRIYYYRVHAEVTGFWQSRNFWILEPVPASQAQVELRSTSAQDGEKKPLPSPVSKIDDTEGVEESPAEPRPSEKTVPKNPGDQNSK